MNIVILGAGGIGCYFGARLLESGHEVTFVGRGEHLAALKEEGLYLEHSDFSFSDQIKAMSIEELALEIDPNSVDVVLVTLKSMVTPEAAERCAQWIKLAKKWPFFVSLQNGVDNETCFTESLGIEKVIGGLTRRIGANIDSPGKISATGSAETIIGCWPNSEETVTSDPRRGFIELLEKSFNEAGIPTEITLDIRKQLWKKLVINNSVNGLAALVQERTGTILKDSLLPRLVMEMMQETGIAAKGDGVYLSQDDINEMFDLICTFESIKPSMLIDRERGRPLEIDEICEVVLQRSEKLGIDAPYTRTVSTLLRFDLKKN